MKDGESCGYCATLLDAHCILHGEEFCEIKEQYFTDPTMGIDDVYDRLLAIATPDQIHEARGMVKQREALGIPPVAVPTAPRPRPNPFAEAAAQRWMTHWQHGTEA